MKNYIKAEKVVRDLFKNTTRKFKAESYAEHCVRTAKNVMKYKQSHQLETLMTAAVLHDVLEDTDYSRLDIEAHFGSKVLELVEELTTPKYITKPNKASYLELHLVEISSWGLVIKLCDRLDNVSDLTIASKQFSQSYIIETRRIISYLIANRLLSVTHLRIISDILILINVADRENKEIKE